MQLKDTPPSSPYNIETMDDDDDLFEDDIIEVIDDEGDRPDIFQENDGNMESDEDDNDGPTRDDATYVFSKHRGSVFCCNLEPKVGNLAVTGGEDDTAYIWKTDSGEVLLICNGHKDSVTCAEFNYDGSYVATGDMSGVVQVWKISNTSKVWETQIGDLSWLKWHHGANVLLGGTVSGEIYMWRIPGGDCKLFPGHGDKTECGLILPDGKRTAVGYEDGSIKIFDMKATTVLHHISQGQAHTGSITGMDCHPDNNLLISGDVDGRAVILKTQTGKVTAVLDCKTSNETDESKKSSVEAVGFCRDSTLSLAATGNLDGVLTIWDVSRGVSRHVIKQDAGISRLLWVKNSHLIYTTGLDGNIRHYDSRSGTVQNTFVGHTAGILDISLSKDCHTLLTSSDDSTARIFSV